MNNEVIESIYKRKSVRVYEKRDIEDDVKREIINCAIQAPTAGNMSLYSIIDITDKKIKDELAILCDNQKFIAEAPLVLLFLADWQRWYDSFNIVLGGNVRKPGVGDIMLASSDAVIAAQNSVVAAESFGVGSCYIGDILENCEKVRELLDIPDFCMPVAMLCFGYPTTQQKNRVKPKRFLAKDMVHENKYVRKDKKALEDMFDGKDNDSFEKSSKALYDRKWSQKFMNEMNRSVEEWMKKFI